MKIHRVLSGPSRACRHPVGAAIARGAWWCLAVSFAVGCGGEDATEVATLQLVGDAPPEAPQPPAPLYVGATRVFSPEGSSRC